jgi:RNA polymerase sigma-70 factor (ECF subfamily)
MTLSPETRASLIRRLHDPRDAQAWREFVAIYEPLILRLVRRRGLQDADAREVAQEVLAAVAAAVGRWQPDPARGTFRGWLFTIARNLTVNFLVQRGRRPLATGRSDVQQWLELLPAAGAAEVALVDEEYRRSVFRWAADRVRGNVRPATWQAFWQTCVEGRSPADVAERLGVSVGNVYVARSRVIARLRRAVEEFEREHSAC